MRASTLGTARGEEFAWCATHEAAEVVDEVCLIGEAEALRQMRHLAGRRIEQGGEDGVQANRAGEGFGRDARVIFELALQLTRREIGAGGEFVQAETPIGGVEGVQRGANG